METNQNTHPAGNRELFFAFFSAVCALFLTNMTLFGGFNLGFGIAVILSVVCTAGYLLRCGCRKSPYALTVLGLCLVIAGSFARSDDAFVKFVMVCFLLVGINLGLGILAGKNRRNPGSAASLADAGFVLFVLGFGELPASTRGLGNAFRSSGTLGRKGGSVLLGLCFAIPVLLVMIPLLMGADAAFEGLLDKLPEFSVSEFLSTLVLGGCLAFILYTRGTALRFYEDTPREAQPRKGLPPLTLNTLLATVVFVYCVYLVSQLAYFTGGFAGLLPKDYTLAQYARRGFFEMAALCGVNLAIMVFSLSLCRDGAPKSTRFLCLFIGLVTVFLVSTASAKMLLYIGSYGLTRLRVLTQVIMVFLAVVTVLVSIWLFVPRLPYMKAVVLVALAMGAAVSWADVDTFVARYNTNAYLSGKMQEIDMAHMGSLGDGAIPYIDRLSREAKDPMVRQMAEDLINHHGYQKPEDWRSWNYVNHNAQEYAPAEIIRDGIAIEVQGDSRGRALYLIVGLDGVTEIEVTTPTTSGGCVHADGSPLKKGEKLWLEQADSLAGVSITTHDKYGEVLWMVDFPKDMDTETYVMDDWIITVE